MGEFLWATTWTVQVLCNFKVMMELTFKKILNYKTPRQVCGRVLSFLVMRKQRSLLSSSDTEINTGSGGLTQIKIISCLLL